MQCGAFRGAQHPVVGDHFGDVALQVTAPAPAEVEDVAHSEGVGRLHALGAAVEAHPPIVGFGRDVIDDVVGRRDDRRSDRGAVGAAEILGDDLVGAVELCPRAVGAAERPPLVVAGPEVRHS